LAAAACPVPVALNVNIPGAALAQGNDVPAELLDWN
jgi:hypothetical protein